MDRLVVLEALEQRTPVSPLERISASSIAPARCQQGTHGVAQAGLPGAEQPMAAATAELALPVRWSRLA